MNTDAEDGAFADTDPADQPRAPGARASRPRDAATLILTRRDGPMLKVLMGRRSAGHAFMPDKWVFPGGRVDRHDARAPSASELRPEVETRLRLHAPRSSPRGLAMAAVRETFEETGLRLARRVAGDSEPLPDLRALDFVARAVTPAYHPRRFDARFFMADAPALLSLERDTDSGELDEIAWFTLAEAQALNLPRITAFVLQEVEARVSDGSRPAPFVRTVRGRRDLCFL